MSNEVNVLVFVREFPILSQTFVVNQVQALMGEDLDVQVLSVLPNRNASFRSKKNPKSKTEPLTTSILPEHHNWKSYFYVFLGVIYCALAKERQNLLKLFFYFLKKKNKFLAKDLMCIVWFLRRKKIVTENCIAHFGSNGVVMDHLIKSKLIKCRNLFTIFHGYEISKYSELDIWQEHYGCLGGILLPISEHWRERLIKLGVSPAQIEVIHMGVDVSEFSYAERLLNPSINILSVARATEKKGLNYAIEAVLNCSLECQYQIIGDGYLMESLKKMVKNHKKSHRIIFEGAKNADFVKESLKRADLFLLPSVTDSQGDMEGIPVSLMEAMACGVVVLSTFHSGIPELIEDGVNGFLVPEKDSKAIERKIFEISKFNSNDLSHIRKNARYTIESQFNARSLNDKLLNLLQQNY